MPGTPGINDRKVLTDNGRLVIVGGPKGDWLAPLVPALKSMLVQPFIDQQVGTMLAELNGEDLAYLATLMESGVLTSRIDRHYSLAEAPEALRYLETQRARGKVIVAVDAAIAE